MFNDKKIGKIRIFTAITFIIMLVANALANILPINGQTTGEVSDSYANLFAPAGYTFSIWGLIYVMLFAYTVYQLGLFRKNTSSLNTELLDHIGLIFSISSIANTMWIFAWHYNVIWLSLVLIIVVLISLILINQEIKKTSLTRSEKFFVKTPFSIYFGWITVATIANVTTYLVSIGWKGFGVAENIWTIIILLVGFLIVTANIVMNRDFVYGLTVVWAYVGILIKHSFKTELNGAYPSVISAVSICIAFLVLVMIYTLFKPRKENKYY